MLEIQLNMYHAVAVAAVLYALGNLLITRIPVLGKYCIPAPLVGGLCFAMVNTACYAAGIAYITFDATLQSVFMTMFFYDRRLYGQPASAGQGRKGGRYLSGAGLGSDTPPECFGGRGAWCAW